MARFCLTLPIKERLNYPPHAPQDHNRAYKLKEFQALKSLTKKYVPKLNGHMVKDDAKFWEIKLWLEHRIRDNGGEGSLVPFEMLLEHMLMFYEFKDKSTAKAKARNIWNWYNNRDWTYHILKHKKDKGEVEMTRTARALANAEKREQEARKKVVNLITGMFADMYRKKSGSWHIGKIAKDANLTEKTVSKHLKGDTQCNTK